MQLSNTELQRNRKVTCGALIDTIKKISFVLVMHVLFNQAAFFISSKQFMRQVSFQ